MDFEAVPAGTLPPAALTLRGPDHTVEFLQTHAFQLVLGDATKSTATLVANTRSSTYSSVSGALSGFAYTRDPAVLTSHLHGSVISPAKLLAIFNHLTQNGIPNNQALTCPEFLAEGETVVGTINHAAFPAALLVTNADLHATEAPAGPIGGAATLWARSAQFLHISEAVAGQPGLYRFRWLGQLHYSAPGVFHTASRDQPGSSYRILLEMCRARAEEAAISHAALGGGYALGTARAAFQSFNGVAARGPWLSFEEGMSTDLHRRLPAFADRLTLAVAPGAAAGESLNFRSVFASQLRSLTDFPGLTEVCSPYVDSTTVAQAIVRLARECFLPERDPPSCLEDMGVIESMVVGALTPLGGQNLLTMGAKVDWLASNVSVTADGTIAGAAAPGGGGGDAAAAAPIVLDTTNAGRLADALNTPGVAAFVATLRGLLGAAPANPLTIAAALAGSDIMMLHRIGIGHPLPANPMLYRDDFARAADKSKAWVYILSMRLASDANGVISSRAAKWRITEALATPSDQKRGERVASAIRDRRYTEVPWLELAYIVRGVQEDTVYAPVPDDIAWQHAEHYTTTGQLAQRVEQFLGELSSSPNSLSNGFERAKQWFESKANLAATREKAVSTVREFIRVMLLTITEEWSAVVMSRDPVIAKPSLVIPATSACWGELTVGDQDMGVIHGLVRAAPKLAAAAGLDVSAMSYPAGVDPGGAAGSSSRAGTRDRSHSRSRSRGRDDGDSGDEDGIARPARGKGKAKAKVGGKPAQPSRKVIWMNKTDFRYSRAGPVVVPTKVGKALGLRVKDRCWPVVMSLAKTAPQRRGYCATPDHPECKSGARHQQDDAIRAYAEQHFDGGRQPGGADRDHTSRAGAKTAREANAEAQARLATRRADRLLMEQDSAQVRAAARGASPRPERAQSRSRSRSRSPRRGADDAAARDRERSRSPRRSAEDVAARGRSHHATPVGRDGRAEYDADDDDDGDDDEPGYDEGSDRDGDDAPERSRDRRAYDYRGRGTGRGADDREGGSSAKGGKGARGKGGKGAKGKGAKGKGSSKGGGRGSWRATATFAATGGGKRGANAAPPPHDDGVPLDAEPTRTAPPPSTGFRDRLQLVPKLTMPALPMPLAATGCFSRMILIIVALVSGGEPAVLLPATGGFYGAALPSTWNGTASQKAITETASRWVPPLLGYPPSVPPAFYAASRRLSPTHTDYFAIAILDHRSTLLQANRGLAAAPVWRGLNQLGMRESFVPSAVAVVRAASYVRGTLYRTSPDLGERGVAANAAAEAALAPGGEFQVGAMAAAPPLEPHPQGFAREPRSFDEMMEVHRAEVAETRRVFSDPGPCFTATEVAALQPHLAASFLDAAGLMVAPPWMLGFARGKGDAAAPPAAAAGPSPTAAIAEPAASAPPLPLGPAATVATPCSQPLPVSPASALDAMIATPCFPSGPSIAVFTPAGATRAVGEAETQTRLGLRAALDAAASGQRVDDVILHRLLLAVGPRQVEPGAPSAARAALRVLTGGANPHDAWPTGGAELRVASRWLTRLTELMITCGLAPATPRSDRPRGSGLAAAPPSPGAAETTMLEGASQAPADDPSAELSDARTAALWFDVGWAAECDLWRDRVTECDASQIPSALRLPGALAAFTDPLLGMLPYSTRCTPPTTARAPPPPPQRAAPDGPRSIEGFFPPGYFREKADWWFIAFRTYLLDALANGEAATAKSPGAIVFGQHEVLAKYRGTLYEYVEQRQRFMPTVTGVRVETHLNRRFADTFSVDYADQEMFSVLDFGVSFKADNAEMQLVLSDHMLSITKGLAKLQADLEKRSVLGWYEVHPFITRMPWRPMKAGMRDKRTGGVRIVINASHPHTPISDDMGVAMRSLNSLSKRSYDELRGADVGRIVRFATRLRSTAGSPPPPATDGITTVVAATAAEERRRPVGRVSVIDDAVAQPHPHTYYGGRDSILGNMLCMRDESERDAACDGFDSILAAPGLNPYAVAGQLGLICHPAQARVDAGARAAFLSVLSSRVARGINTQLRCHCAPRRCHLDGAAAVVRAEANELRAQAPAAPRWFGAKGRRPTLLHLFAGAGGGANQIRDYARAAGVGVIDVDSLTGRNLLDDDQYDQLHALAAAGDIDFVVAGIPCETHSIARHRPHAGASGRRARPLRDRSRGGAPFPWLTAAERKQVAVSDKLTKRACAIIRRAAATGAGYIIENPVDRGAGPYEWRWANVDSHTPHSPLWVSDEVVSLRAATGGKMVSFAQCPFNSLFQKLTTFMYVADEADSLRDATCRCMGHRKVAVGHDDEDGRVLSAAAAAYPDALNERIVQIALAHILSRGPRTGRPLVGTFVPRSLVLDQRVLAEDAECEKWPKETKVSTAEYMERDAHLKHVCVHLDTFLVVQNDDFKDWFYQLKLAADNEWLVGFIVLELGKLAEEHPELRFLIEKVLGQGTVPGSNLGQRLCYLTLDMWDVIFDALDRPHREAEIAACPALVELERARAAAGVAPLALHSRGGYTDDTRFSYCGPPRSKRGAKAWFVVTVGFRVIMAEAVKRQLGQHDLTLGVNFNSTLGIAFVEAEKVERCRDTLRSLLHGTLSVEDYRSLLGLLLHVSFLADMSRSATHGMFTPVTPGGAISLGLSTPVAGPHLTSLIRQQAARWLECLERSAGAPYTAAVPMLARRHTLRAADEVQTWRSDSCKEGTAHPGIAGTRGGEFWVRPLTPQEAELLPVPVTEFCGFYGNLEAFGGSTPDGVAIEAEIDAITPAFVLTREASQSPLMQHVLRRVKAHPHFRRLCDRMIVRHLSGEANWTSDRASRGMLAELLAFYDAAGAAVVQMSAPPSLDSLLAELVLMEMARRAPRTSTSIGTHNLGMYGPPIAHPSLEPIVQTVSSTPLAAAVGLIAPIVHGIGAAARGATSTAAAAPPVVVSLSGVGIKRPRAGGSAAALPAPIVASARSDALPPPLPAVAHAPIIPPAPLFALASAVPLLAPITDAVCAWVSAHMSSETPAATLAARLRADSSEYALRPADPADLDAACAGVFDDSMDNPGSTRKLGSNMKLWRQYCDSLHTPHWRPAQSDLDAFGREREALLAANFIPWALQRMRGRRGMGKAKPQSAYKAYLGVRKAHRKRLIDLAPTALVWTMVQRHCRRYLEEHGGMALIIKRKQPFTQAILHSLLTATGKAGPVDLGDASTRYAFRAFTAVLRQTGMRKSELALQRGEQYSRRHASRANLSWCLRGRVYSSPPPELLANPRAGDHAILVPPVSKADANGEVWGALPIYLHHSADPDAAFHHLAALELAMPVAASARAHVPLISPDGARPFAGAALDAALLAILTRLLGRAGASLYSWHSARIYLACALLAAGATGPQIQALCRWQSEDSLRVYARLNAARYDSLLSSAAAAPVLSVSTASLPALSSELALRALLGLTAADLRSAETEAAAGAE